jgi:hypothetical protein
MIWFAKQIAETTPVDLEHTGRPEVEVQLGASFGIPSSVVCRVASDVRRVRVARVAACRSGAQCSVLTSRVLGAGS